MAIGAKLVRILWTKIGANMGRFLIAKTATHSSLPFPYSSSWINSFALLVIITLLIYIVPVFIFYYFHPPALRLVLGTDTGNQQGVLVSLDAAFDEGIINLS